MHDRYQASQQHPETSHVMQYHQMDHYPEGPVEDPTMAGLSAQRDPSLYQESFYHNYPQTPNHYQEQVCEQNFREHEHQQHPPHQHMFLQQPQHEYTVQQHPPYHHTTLQHPQHQRTFQQHPQHQYTVQQQPQNEYTVQQHAHLHMVKQHPQPHHTVQQHPQPHHTVQQHPQPHHTIQEHPQPHHTVQQHPQHHHTFQQHPQPHHTVQQHPQPHHTVQQHPQHQLVAQQQEPRFESSDLPQVLMPAKKKRGRPSKQQAEDKEIKEEEDEAEAAKKAKRILNRFNGMSVAEVMAKTLPDVITYNLDILIIGINPGLLSAFKGHHYPNPGNHFWKCLFLSGLTEQQLNYMHDHNLPEKYSIGFTNMVERTTPGSKDLSSKEIREGGRQLLDKLQKFKPLIAAFNGKGIYEIFCKEIFGVKAKNLEFGLQPYRIPETETVCFLMPSSSPRCAQFPRAQDKVHFYIKLKELRDQMKGLVPSHDVVETQYAFDLQLAKEDAKRLAIKEEQVDPEYESCSGVHEEARQTS